MFGHYSKDNWHYNVPMMCKWYFHNNPIAKVPILALFESERIWWKIEQLRIEFSVTINWLPKTELKNDDCQTNTPGEQEYLNKGDHYLPLVSAKVASPTTRSLLHNSRFCGISLRFLKCNSFFIWMGKNFLVLFTLFWEKWTGLGLDS